MKPTISVTTVIQTDELKQYSHDLAELLKVVKAANGRYILYVDTVKSPATQPLIISKAEFDNAISATMFGSPRAFSPKVNGGKFLPNRLNAAYAAYTREQAKTQARANSSRKVIRNRAEYLAVYGDQFKLFPDSKMGRILNNIITKELK